MREKWDAASIVGAVVIAAIFGCLAISVGGGWTTIASSEGQTWAAWFQGIGSVAAILAAIWLHERGNFEASSRAKAHAVIFRSGLTDVLITCAKHAEARDRGKVLDCMFMCKEVAHLGQSIQMDRLDDQMMLRIAQWRTLTARTQALLEQWNSQMNVSPLDYISLRREFQIMLLKLASEPQAD